MPASRHQEGQNFSFSLQVESESPATALTCDGGGGRGSGRTAADGVQPLPLTWAVEKVFAAGQKQARILRIAAMQLTGLWLQFPVECKSFYVTHVRTLALYGVAPGCVPPHHHPIIPTEDTVELNLLATHLDPWCPGTTVLNVAGYVPPRPACARFRYTLDQDLDEELAYPDAVEEWSLLPPNPDPDLAKTYENSEHVVRVTTLQFIAQLAAQEQCEGPEHGARPPVPTR